MRLKIKRLGAYIIDYMFVILISSMICEFNIFDNYTNKYLESYESVEKINNEIITDLDVNKVYTEEYANLYNQVIRYGGVATIVSLVCHLLYFVGFQKWNHNQTLGKKIFGLEVCSVNKDDVSWGSYILRTLIVYGLGFNLITFILAFWLEGVAFVNSALIVNLCSIIVNYACLFLILFRVDGRGLHDLIAGTVVKEKANI